ncbi:hypothetical protein [Yersinia rohdei]|nr:hypothetical protein [Yersinia rohdei]
MGAPAAYAATTPALHFPSNQLCQQSDLPLTLLIVTLLIVTLLIVTLLVCFLLVVTLFKEAHRAALAGRH